MAVCTADRICHSFFSGKVRIWDAFLSAGASGRRLGENEGAGEERSDVFDQEFA